MLRACRSLLRRGRTLAFTTIHLAPDASAADRRRAVEAGPRAITHRSEHERLLHSAGFAEISHEDLTDAFLRTARAWLEVSDRHADDLAEFEGHQSFDERQAGRRQLIAAVEAGVLRRSLYVGRVP